MEEIKDNLFRKNMDKIISVLTYDKTYNKDYRNLGATTLHVSKTNDINKIYVEIWCQNDEPLEYDSIGREIINIPYRSFVNAIEKECSPSKNNLYIKMTQISHDFAEWSVINLKILKKLIKKDIKNNTIDKNFDYIYSNPPIPTPKNRTHVKEDFEYISITNEVESVSVDFSDFMKYFPESNYIYTYLLKKNNTIKEKRKYINEAKDTIKRIKNDLKEHEKRYNKLVERYNNAFNSLTDEQKLLLEIMEIDK